MDYESENSNIDQGECHEEMDREDSFINKNSVGLRDLLFEYLQFVGQLPQEMSSDTAVRIKNEKELVENLYNLHDDLSHNRYDLALEGIKELWTKLHQEEYTVIVNMACEQAIECIISYITCIAEKKPVWLYELQTADELAEKLCQPEISDIPILFQRLDEVKNIQGKIKKRLDLLNEIKKDKETPIKDVSGEDLQRAYSEGLEIYDLRSDSKEAFKRLRSVENILLRQSSTEIISKTEELQNDLKNLGKIWPGITARIPPKSAIDEALELIEKAKKASNGLNQAEEQLRKSMTPVDLGPDIITRVNGLIKWLDKAKNDLKGWNDQWDMLINHPLQQIQTRLTFAEIEKLAMECSLSEISDLQNRYQQELLTIVVLEGLQALYDLNIEGAKAQLSKVKGQQLEVEGVTRLKEGIDHLESLADNIHIALRWKQTIAKRDLSSADEEWGRLENIIPEEINKNWIIMDLRERHQALKKSLSQVKDDRKDTKSLYQQAWNYLKEGSLEKIEKLLEDAKRVGDIDFYIRWTNRLNEASKLEESLKLVKGGALYLDSVHPRDKRTCEKSLEEEDIDEKRLRSAMNSRFNLIKNEFDMAQPEVIATVWAKHHETIRLLDCVISFLGEDTRMKWEEIKEHAVIAKERYQWWICGEKP